MHKQISEKSKKPELIKFFGLSALKLGSKRLVKQHLGYFETDFFFLKKKINHIGKTMLFRFTVSQTTRATRSQAP